MKVVDDQQTSGTSCREHQHCVEGKLDKRSMGELTTAAQSHVELVRICTTRPCVDKTRKSTFYSSSSDECASSVPKRKVNTHWHTIEQSFFTWSFSI